MKHFIISLGSC